MNKTDFLTVASYQGPIQEGNSAANLAKVLQVTMLAEERGVDILVFPESYLHGYFETESFAKEHAIDLASPAFTTLCANFSGFQHTTVLLGLNELAGDKIYNTVVVIEKGKCLGKYRKAYTYEPYQYYSLGREFPVFTKHGIKYGIIICLDSAFREPAHLAALQGARIIFCPSFNRVPREAHMLNYLQRKSHFISRAFDNHCWLVVSDIIWDDQDAVAPGYSSIFNDDGELVVRSELFTEMLLTYTIPIKNLQAEKKSRLMGNPILFEMVKAHYDNAAKE